MTAATKTASRSRRAPPDISVQQWFVDQLNERIEAHAAEERDAVKRSPLLRQAVIDAAAKVAGVDLTAKNVKATYRTDYEYVDFDVRCARPGLSLRYRVCAKKNPDVRAAHKAQTALAVKIKGGCKECEQLRRLVDTNGVNSWTAFLRARFGRLPTLEQAKAAFSDFLKLRAPAACPVI
jgi:hypothetical protein